MPRAVLFDMDGVLADSHAVWLHVLNDVAERLGCAPISEAQLDDAFGQGLVEDQRVFYPGTSLAELTRQYEQVFPRHIGHMRANPEARSALAALRAAGVRVAVVTNTPQSLAEDILRVLGLHPHVEFTSGLRPGLDEKPAPDLILDALAHLRVAAAEAVMIGDSRYDELAAQAAGVPFRRYELKAGTPLGTFLSDAP